MFISAGRDELALYSGHLTREKKILCNYWAGAEMRLCVGASSLVERILRRPAGNQTPIVQSLAITFTARLTWKLTEVECPIQQASFY